MSVPVVFEYLKLMGERKASDLYLTVGAPPTLRTDEGLQAISQDTLRIEVVNEVLASVLTSRQRREYETNLELNTALDMGEYGRFRVNVLRQRGQPALVIRRIVSMIPSFEELSLPEVLKTLALEKRGLVLITGMTGSGKSTTLASMIDCRNASQQGHIITIEDPIEYFHDHKQSIVTQREVGIDTESYEIALKNALRQRPDVVLVGEIRDRQVMEQALTAAETGHLCLATIHTNNSYQAIERIVNLFPEDYANQIRLNLSLNLRAIISQRLLPSLHGGVSPALEVMLNQGFIKDLIVKGEIGKVKDILEQNNAQGMCSFEQSLLAMYNKKIISEEVALANTDQPSELKIKIEQSKLSDAGKGGLSSMDTSRLSFSD